MTSADLRAAPAINRVASVVYAGDRPVSDVFHLPPRREDSQAPRPFGFGCPGVEVGRQRYVAAYAVFTLSEAVLLVDVRSKGLSGEERTEPGPKRLVFAIGKGEHIGMRSVQPTPAGAGRARPTPRGVSSTSPGW